MSKRDYRDALFWLSYLIGLLAIWLLMIAACSAAEPDVAKYGVYVTVEVVAAPFNGSGVLVEGGVLTAYHCVDSHVDVICEADGETSVGTVTRWNKDADIAFVSVKWKKPHWSANLSDVLPSKSSKLFSVGRPNNGAINSMEHTFVRIADISKVAGQWHQEIVVSPSFNLGRSGGGLFNENGDLVGIVTSSDLKAASDRHGYATSVADIRKMLKGNQ